VTTVLHRYNTNLSTASKSNSNLLCAQRGKKFAPMLTTERVYAALCALYHGTGALFASGMCWHLQLLLPGLVSS
jgi:hypothetical protein